MSQSENWFSGIMDYSPDVISIIGKDGELLFNSPAAARIHGYTTEEMAHRNTLELMHADDVEHVSAAMRELSERPGGFVTVQYRYLHKDGTYTWMEAIGYNQLENSKIGGIVTISRDISERKKIDGKLREALAARDEFISIASHEFKSPLTVIKGHLDLLIQQLGHATHPMPPAELLIASLELAGRQVERLVALVGALLDVTRIRSGKLDLECAEFDLSATVLETASQFALPLSDAGCALVLHIAPRIVGRWDNNRIGQVIENLFSNAIKYAPGQPITASLVRDGDRVRFSLRDRGPGIPADQHEKIFQRFERVTASRTISGLGLGLYISKQIVDAHGGRLYLESEAGQGATLTMELPL